MSTSDLSNLTVTQKPATHLQSFPPKSAYLDPSQIGRIGKGIPFYRSYPYDRKIHYQDSEKPHLIRFFPVSEKQLVRDSVSLSTYSRSNVGQTKDLLYRVIKTDGKIVRSILELSGFSYTDSHDWNILWLGCAPQLYIYEGLNEHQRINHFPNSYEITRKDRMAVHLRKMQEKFGAEEYGFFPATFIMPEDYFQFQDLFNADKAVQWIVKPSNSSQGKGIFLLENLASLQGNDSFVVSKYIKDPLLLKSLKFDLRIYVLVTCYDPLRIYIYDEGLARFASEPYSSSGKTSKYSYLTNYSINKKNEKFVQNTDFKEDNVGHKWSLSALVRELEKENITTSALISDIYDLVIKTIIAIEPEVVIMIRKLAVGRNNCFDLLGFDVIIDSSLKPWLLEVNLSPSLSTDSPLDLFIKGNLVADTLNLVGLRFFDRKKESMNTIKARIRAKQNKEKEKPSDINPWYLNRAQTAPTRKELVCDYSKYKLCIQDTVSESKRLGNFVRIYPCQGSDAYDRFFAQPRGSNKTVYNYLYVLEHKEELEKPPEVKKSAKKIELDKEVQKVVITADDILIEYLSRVLHAARTISFDRLKHGWKIAIERFVNHQIWASLSANFNYGLGLLNKLESRISEMKERQKKNEGKEIPNLAQKHLAIRNFSALQLENMLKGSKKSLLKEIAGCFFSEDFGILTEMIQFIASCSSKNSGFSVSRQSGFNTDDGERSSSRKGYELNRRYNHIFKAPNSAFKTYYTNVKLQNLRNDAYSTE